MWQASERFFQCWLSSTLKVCEGTHLERHVIGIIFIRALFSCWCLLCGDIHLRWHVIGVILITALTSFQKLWCLWCDNSYQLGTVAFIKVMMRTCQHVGALIRPGQCYKYSCYWFVLILQIIRGSNSCRGQTVSNWKGSYAMSYDDCIMLFLDF